MNEKNDGSEIDKKVIEHFMDNLQESKKINWLTLALKISGFAWLVFISLILPIMLIIFSVFPELLDQCR